MHTHTYTKYIILYYRCIDEHSSLMKEVKEKGGRGTEKREVYLAAQEPGWLAICGHRGQLHRIWWRSMDNLRNVFKHGYIFPPVYKEEGAGNWLFQILYLFHFPLTLFCRCFSRSDHLALHMKRHI